MGYIYRITNLINGKAYIGETIQDVEKRWQTHRNLSKLNKGCPALKEAFNKYGISNFKFEVLIICFDEDRLIYEKQYIKKYNTVAPNGYNISEGGNERGFTGLHHTDEVKKKISEAVKKRYDNPEERQKAREKMIKVYKERGIIEKRNQNKEYMSKILKKINKISLQGNIIKTFDSIADACRETNIYRSSITKVLYKKGITAGGFKWEYADKETT